MRERVCRKQSEEGGKEPAERGRRRSVDGGQAGRRRAWRRAWGTLGGLVCGRARRARGGGDLI